MNDSLDFLFSPASIAIVGATANPEKQGWMYLKKLLDFGFPGLIYPVNPRGGEILGQKVYTSLAETPGPIDYVISTVPAPQLPPVIQQCGPKGVKVLVLYTAQLGETGHPEGKAEEARLVALARAQGVRVLGPNCMGVYCPRAGLTFRYSSPREPGEVGLLFQSAGNAAEAIYRGAARGLRFSKAISYGNAADINETELLEYLGQDPETRLIGAYIEGVRDRHFPQVLRQVAREKPVVIYKVGRTEAGARAAASHTGSLAGSVPVFNALVKQAGAVAVSSMEELVDVLLCLAFLPPPHGIDVAAMGAGGGGSTGLGDELETRGLRLPPFPEEVNQELQSLLGEDWYFLRNPVDSSVIFPNWGPSLAEAVFRLLARHPLYSLLMADGGEWGPDHPNELERYQAMVDIFVRVCRESGKPALLVIRTAEGAEDWRLQAVARAVDQAARARLPSFPSLLRAAQALGQFTRYHQAREEKITPAQRRAR